MVVQKALPTLTTVALLTFKHQINRAVVDGVYGNYGDSWQFLILALHLLTCFLYKYNLEDV